MGKWGPYGFDLDGVQRLEEYYPNALEETYAGVSGYIYGAEPANTSPVSDVPFAVTSEEAVAVVSCEFVPDAYEAILRAEREGCCAFCTMRRPAIRSAPGYGKP